MNLIQKAINDAGGVTAFTKQLNSHIARPVTYQAVRKWAAQGKLPRTEWTGESHYANAIEIVSIASGSPIARDELLRSCHPHAEQIEQVAQQS